MTDLKILEAAAVGGDFEIGPYSGRGMYGKTCAGIWGDFRAVLRCVVLASPSVFVAARLIHDTRHDSPVVYWPNVELLRDYREPLTVKLLMEMVSEIGTVDTGAISRETGYSVEDIEKVMGG